MTFNQKSFSGKLVVEKLRDLKGEKGETGEKVMILFSNYLSSYIQQ